MTKGDKSVTMNTECVNIHEGKKMHWIECPKDFLDYFSVFLEFKNINVGLLKFSVYNNKADLARIKAMNGKRLSDYSAQELKALYKTQLKAYKQSQLADLSKVTPRKNLHNINVVYPFRPVFLELFELVLWSFMQYLYQIDIPLDGVVKSYDPVKVNLAQLVKNTLYTDNEIKAPININLERYDLAKPKKLSDKYLTYGKLFIEAADLYRRLRMYWLTLVREYPPAAELLETLLADTVKFGYRYCNLRYVKSFSRGGITKDKKTDAVRIKIHNIYDKLKDQRISMSALAGQILSSKENMRTIEFLERKYFIPQLNTIKKWVKEWDYENNIDRSKYPRARKMRHF